MNLSKMIIVLLSLFCAFSSFAQWRPGFRKSHEKTDVLTIKKTPLFFSPSENGLRQERPRIDYDLTYSNILRLGPYVLKSDEIEMYLTREQSEFFYIDFGLELSKRVGSLYVVSFKWPRDYIKGGVLEIIDDEGFVYWRTSAEKKAQDLWKSVIRNNEEPLVKYSSAESNVPMPKKRTLDNGEQVVKKTARVRIIPKGVSLVHRKSHFGLAHKSFFELPISEIKKPFRYCISKDEQENRIAICSKRYRFKRSGGRYVLTKVSKKGIPKVLVNDKPVTLKGSAIFLENNKSMKFSALLENGTYYEFVSSPKKINILDVTYDSKRKLINVVGSGDPPLGQVEESYYANVKSLGFQEYLSRDGLQQKLWKATFSDRDPHLYFLGSGGAPFRYDFVYEALPMKIGQVKLEQPKLITYRNRLYLKGTKSPKVKLMSVDGKVKDLGERFEWNYELPVKGAYNRQKIKVKKGSRKWIAHHEIYRGKAYDFSMGVGQLLSVHGEYWLEDLMGWQDPVFSRLHWGLYGSYYKTLSDVSLLDNGVSKNLELSVMDLDLRYRFTSGIHKVGTYYGVAAGLKQISFQSQDSLMTLGGGLFYTTPLGKGVTSLFTKVPEFKDKAFWSNRLGFYPVTTDKNTTLKGIWQLQSDVNAYFTDSVYLKFGLGLHGIKFNKDSDSISADFSGYEVNVGLGIQL